MDMRVRIVWDLPVDEGVFYELGKAIHTIASASRMDLELADSEGMIFRIEPVKLFDIDGEALRETIDELNRSFCKVRIHLED